MIAKPLEKEILELIIQVNDLYRNNDTLNCPDSFDLLSQDMNTPLDSDDAKLVVLNRQINTLEVN